MKPSVFCVALGLAALGRLPSSHAGLLISEIMHHPGSGLPAEQFIELQNSDPTSASLQGWKLSGQIDFAFTDQVIPGGGFLVVVADADAFTAHYPGVTNYVGNWTGMLDNQGTIRLRNATNDVVASVHYYSEGDWSERGLLPNLGIIGWEWTGLHDGGGSSLELVNPLMPIDAGQNWDSSIDIDGTPGAPNSVHQINSAPLISGVTHHPILPSPVDPVTVVAHLLDEPGSAAPTATLHWRVDANPTNAFQLLPMRDDGSQGDGAAQDGTYGATLPALPLGTIVEYFITAADAAGHSRTYPRVDPTATRTANLVYQVDTAAPIGNIPLYRVILTAAEKQALDAANATQALSDAGASGAFVTQDASSIDIRQLVTFRNRGHGSRYNFPHNIKVAIPADNAWNGRTGINLNSGTPFLQMVGSAVMREIGLIMAESRLVTVLVNGVNHAGEGAPLYQYGYFAANWEVNSDLIAAQAPDNAGGNIYRAIRNRISGNRTANLVWHGTNSQAYADPYFKQNHYLANDWSDLIDLIAVLNSTNGYAASNYIADVGRRLNVKQWMRYFASQTILDNQETNLSTGYGDDYAVYARLRDSRFLLLPYDLDSIFHFGNASPFDGLFRMAIPGVGSDVPVIDRLIKTPEFVRLYYAELKELAQGPMSDAALIPLLDRLLANTTIPAAIVADMKAFNASRVAYILSQIPTGLSVSSNLPIANGYFRTTNSPIRLEGRSDATRTARVLVAGVPATWTAWTARWVSTNVTLNPGINRLLVTSLDEREVEFDRQLVEVWYDAGTTTPAQTTISTPTRWTAAEGPYTLNGTLNIAAGGSLILEPGTTV